MADVGRVQYRWFLQRNLRVLAGSVLPARGKTYWHDGRVESNRRNIDVVRGRNAILVNTGGDTDGHRLFCMLGRRVTHNRLNVSSNNM